MILYNEEQSWERIVQQLLLWQWAIFSNPITDNTTMMISKSKSIRLSLGIVLGLVAIPLMALSAVGQTSPYPENSNDGFQSNEQDSTFGADGFNPLDLIHRSRMMNRRSMGEFSQETQRNINRASDDFRRQQLELLQQQMQQQNNQPVAQPEATEEE